MKEKINQERWECLFTRKIHSVYIVGGFAFFEKYIDAEGAIFSPVFPHDVFKSLFWIALVNVFHIDRFVFPEEIFQNKFSLAFTVIWFFPIKIENDHISELLWKFLRTAGLDRHTYIGDHIILRKYMPVEW